MKYNHGRIHLIRDYYYYYFIREILSSLGNCVALSDGTIFYVFKLTLKMFLHFPGIPRNTHYKTQTTFIQLTCTARKSGYVEQNAPDFLVVVNAFHSSHLLLLKTLQVSVYISNVSRLPLPRERVPSIKALLPGPSLPLRKRKSPCSSPMHA